MVKAMSAANLTQLRRDIARLAIQYHHWRVAGFPNDHPYHLHVAIVEADLRALQEAEHK
jgi:hypothetical protein